MDVKALLTKKYGPAPVWVYASVGILGLAWWLSRRNKSVSTPDESEQEIPEGYPMNYSSDIFVNYPQSPAPGNGRGTGPIPRGPGSAPVPSGNGTVTGGTPVPIHPPRRVASVTYVVKKGDNLWNIAKNAYGNGAANTRIYQANKTLIENVARQHGFTSSNNGARIWPGERLVVPR